MTYRAIAEVFTNIVTLENDESVDERTAFASDLVNVVLGVLRSDPFLRNGSAVSDSRHRVTIDSETGGITIWREEP